MHRFYWRARSLFPAWLVLMGGILVGLGLGFYEARFARTWELLPACLGISGLVAWPFSLRTATRRIWWMAWLMAILGVAALRWCGLRSLGGWLLLGITALAYGVAVWLRWRPVSD